MNAIKDRKIDAFFWVGGVPTAALTDLAATPGTKIRLIDHAEALDAMNKKYGPLYVKGMIAPTSYQGMDKPVGEHRRLEHPRRQRQDERPDGLRHREDADGEEARARRRPQGGRRTSSSRYQKIGSPVPYHPGAKKYFEEQGVKF